MDQFYYPASGAKRIKLAHYHLAGVEVVMQIGIDAKEVTPQKITIDVVVGVGDYLTNIVDSKEGLVNGFDYSQIYEGIQTATGNAKLHEGTNVTTAKPVKLLETLGNNIAAQLLTLTGVFMCEIKISKNRHWANVDKAGITIFRER